MTQVWTWLLVGPRAGDGASLPFACLLKAHFLFHCRHLPYPILFVPWASHPAQSEHSFLRTILLDPPQSLLRRDKQIHPRARNSAFPILVFVKSHLDPSICRPILFSACLSSSRESLKIDHHAQGCQGGYFFSLAGGKYTRQICMPLNTDADLATSVTVYYSNSGRRPAATIITTTLLAPSHQAILPPTPSLHLAVPLTKPHPALRLIPKPTLLMPHKPLPVLPA